MHILAKITCSLIVFSALLASCNLEQEVDIELPAYNDRPVVEFYLEPGQPFRALITRSDAYFDDLPSLENFPGGLLLEGAEVEVSYGGNTVRLNNQLFFNPQTGKLYNYIAEAIVPDQTGEEFELLITYPNGTVTTAQTTLLPKVQIDSVVVEYPDDLTDTLARALTYFTDPAETSNFYRRTLHLNTLDSLPEQDFIADDGIVDDNLVVFGTGFDFEEGDTLINTLYHISEEYATFLESIDAAAAANGNPFGQPSPIISNLQGNANAIGIFTGLVYDRRFDIVEGR